MDMLLHHFLPLPQSLRSTRHQRRRQALPQLDTTLGRLGVNDRMYLPRPRKRLRESLPAPPQKPNLPHGCEKTIPLTPIPERLLACKLVRFKLPDSLHWYSYLPVHLRWS